MGCTEVRSQVCLLLSPRHPTNPFINQSTYLSTKCHNIIYMLIFSTPYQNLQRHRELHRQKRLSTRSPRRGRRPSKRHQGQSKTQERRSQIESPGLESEECGRGSGGEGMIWM